MSSFVGATWSVWRIPYHEFHVRFEGLLAKRTPEEEAALVDLRSRVHALVPDCFDTFTYGKPAMAIDSGPVMAYGITGQDLVVYLLDGAVTERRAELLAPWKTTKGTVRHSISDRLPDDVLSVLVADRLARLDEIARERRLPKGPPDPDAFDPDAAGG